MVRMNEVVCLPGVKKKVNTFKNRIGLLLRYYGMPLISFAQNLKVFLHNNDNCKLTVKNLTRCLCTLNCSSRKGLLFMDNKSKMCYTFHL